MGAGAWLNPQNLQKAVTELATAVAGGTDTTQAKTDFNALFTNTNVAQTTIDKTFNDLIQTIQDSKVTTADLNAVATDQAAIQTDLNNLTSSHGSYVPGFRGLGQGQSLGSNFASSLSATNVPVSPSSGASDLGQGLSWTSQNTQLTQLNTDRQKLQTDLQTLTAKSGVTVADLSTLQTDSQTIAGAGLRLNPQSLQKVVTKLVTAVTNGADTSQAKTDFNALFTGSNVAQATIDKSFNDLIQTIQDSKLTAADLSTITADRTAIQTDLSNLHSSSGSGSGHESGSGSGSTGGGTGTGTGNSGRSSTTIDRGGFRRFRSHGRFRR
jgi:hypothetical protein